ncbi:hypothetical protein, partial [Vogesella alkaliphila]|uniref:hypothetical protein n=1 Tax=Vogesella alkaliphila TaxID=1193621 RepID=UPI00167BEE2A
MLGHPLYSSDAVTYIKEDKILQELRKALQEGTDDIEIIHQAAGVSTWHDLISLLACLDVEFCDSQFFCSDVYRMERIPLFSLVLPEADLDQIQLGKNPPRKWVNPPFKRLIEFHAFILESKQQGKWPTTMPTPQQQDRYFSPHDPKDGESMHLPNLRSGRNKLPISKYLAMWNHGYQLLEGSDGLCCTNQLKAERPQSPDRLI